MINFLPIWRSRVSHYYLIGTSRPVYCCFVHLRGYYYTVLHVYGVVVSVGNIHKIHLCKEKKDQTPPERVEMCPRKLIKKLKYAIRKSVDPF